MAVETNVPLDQGAMAIPAQFVNRVQVSAGGPNLRLAFAEGFGGQSFVYRAAIVMTLQDAKEFAEAILSALDRHEKVVQQEAQRRG